MQIVNKRVDEKNFILFERSLDSSCYYEYYLRIETIFE